MSSEQVQNMAGEGADGAAPGLNASAHDQHDNVAAATASGVDSAIAGAEAQGGSVGTVEGDPKRDTTPKVEAVPAAAEQQAVDDSYKSGDSPYEFSRGDANAEDFKAEADRVYGK